MKNLIVLVSLMVAFFMSGCSNKVVVILLPKADGSVGKVSVTENNSTTLLDKPWQKIETQNNGKTEILSQEVVKSQYKELLQGMPEEANNYRLYFKFDSPFVTNASYNILKKVVQDIKSRPVLQIDVIGYSDRAGKESYNKILSLKRAKAVMKYMIKEGINSDIIRLDYYGEANSLVHTADGVANKQNRRVEVTIK